MRTKNMELGDKILFILGVSLCVVFVFLLVVGVIIAMFTSGDRKQLTRTGDLDLINEPEEAYKQIDHFR